MINLWVKIRSLVFSTVCNIQFDILTHPGILMEWISLLCEVNCLLSVLHRKHTWVRHFCILHILLFQCMPWQILSCMLCVWQPVLNERQAPRFLPWLVHTGSNCQLYLWDMNLIRGLKMTLTSSLPLWPSSAACVRQIARGGHGHPTAKPGVSLHTHCECGRPRSGHVQFNSSFCPCVQIFVPRSMTSCAFYIFPVVS